MITNAHISGCITRSLSEMLPKLNTPSKTSGLSTRKQYLGCISMLVGSVSALVSSSSDNNFSSYKVLTEALSTEQYAPEALSLKVLLDSELSRSSLAHV